jgi:transcription elongation factor GreA
MIPVTAEGKRKLQEELERIEARMPVVRKAIEEAREKGDLKENAEYHAAREELGLLQARRGEIGGKLTQAVVVDESLIDRDTVAFGARVTLKDLSDRSSEEWTLVGEGEDDPLENKILTTSPMGQALIGRKVGDTIEVAAPVGKLRFSITKLAYDG